MVKFSRVTNAGVHDADCAVFSEAYRVLAMTGPSDRDHRPATDISDPSRKTAAKERGFSPAFWRFYNRQEPLKGFIAYGLYKKHKWQLLRRKGWNRDDKRLNNYDIDDFMVGVFKDQANDLINRYDRDLADKIRKDLERDEIHFLREEQRRKSGWRGFIASVPSNFAMAATIPALWFGVVIAASAVFPSARADLGSFAIKASMWMAGDTKATVGAIHEGLEATNDGNFALASLLEQLVANAADSDKSIDILNAVVGGLDRRNDKEQVVSRLMEVAVKLNRERAMAEMQFQLDVNGTEAAAGPPMSEECR